LLRNGDQGWFLAPHLRAPVATILLCIRKNSGENAATIAVGGVNNHLAIGCDTWRIHHN